MKYKKIIKKWCRLILVLTAIIFTSTASLNTRFQPYNPKNNTLGNETGKEREMLVKNSLIWLLIVSISYSIKEMLVIKKSADITAPAEETNMVCLVSLAYLDTEENANTLSPAP